MMDSKHTPGPWTKDRHGQLRSPDGRQVTVWGAGLAWGNRDDETEANGSLVGAAPDLLSALMECGAYFDNRADADCDQDGFIPNEEMKLLSEVREAIAKATA